MNELHGILILLGIVCFLLAFMYQRLYKQEQSFKDYWYEEYLKAKRDLHDVLKSSDSENKIG